MAKRKLNNNQHNTRLHKPTQINRLHTRHRKKLTGKEKIVTVISVTLFVISLTAVLTVVFYNGRFFGGENGTVINDNNGEDNTNTPDNINSTDGKLNFLLCGLDESETLTDIIMVVSVDAEKNTADILQIPRDTYVEGLGLTGKINGAYSKGDKSLSPVNRLIKVINEQYQLRIDHYGTITIDSFRDVIDAIGGVPIDMPYQIGNEELGIIPKGYQVLDGAHAEWLVRHRHSYYDQDIGRIKVQRLFLASALQQVRRIGMKEATKLVPALYGKVTTDLSINEIIGFSGLAFGIPMEEIHIYMVPGEGVNYKGQSVWSMHRYETADLLNAYFRPGNAPVPAEKLPIKELAHTGSFYENTEDDFGSLTGGNAPGKPKDENRLPVYTHVVTQPTTVPPETTPPQTTATSVTTDENRFDVPEHAGFDWGNLKPPPEVTSFRYED